MFAVGTCIYVWVHFMICSVGCFYYHRLVVWKLVNTTHSKLNTSEMLTKWNMSEILDNSQHFFIQNNAFNCSKSQRYHF